MYRMWSIDPGTKYVGLACWSRSAVSSAWHVDSVATLTPDEFLVQFANEMLAGTLQHVVYERFIVEAARAPMLAGDELEVVQMIGALKWIFKQCSTNNDWPGYTPVLVGQTNKIKKPTAGLLRMRGIKSMARKTKQPGDHAFDAELHGYHYLIHTLKEL